MRVEKAHVEGFRLLDGVTLSFEDPTTIIVGRNNSGKTSFVEVFFKFLGTEKSSFSFDDFSLGRINDLCAAGELWKQAQDERGAGKKEKAETSELAAIAKLPSIKLDIEFVYEESDSLAPIANLVLDLNLERHDALLRCHYHVERPSEFFKAFEKSSEKDIVAFTRRGGQFFCKQFVAVDKEDDSNTRELEIKQVKDAIFCNFIYAQNRFDDTSLDSGHGLSKGFESYYRAIAGDGTSIANLEAELAKVGSGLDQEYLSLFAPVFEDLRVFGAGRMPNLQDVKVVSELRAESLLKGSTKVMYVHDSGSDLPEAHNGLGFSKLIFIVLQFVAFFEACKARRPSAGVELLFLEEPEAHLHPQMQAVFIKNINDYLASKPEWNIQLIVTTHSAHIIADSGFTSLRYFDTSTGLLEIKDLNAFKVELTSREQDVDAKSLKFLQQYMAIHKCDMFFADKIILVEGTVERLVLPVMIKQDAASLQNEYVSIIEVGGAYALKFQALLEFLAIPTLVITDIDSVEESGRHKKTPVKTPHAITANETLKKWLPKETSISALLSKEEAEKLCGSVRVAYQIPEDADAATGRSFEEAFILANAGVLVKAEGLSCCRIFRDENDSVLTEKQVQSDAYRIADDLKKTDFAFDILSMDGWITPTYISEGLKWLAQQNK